MAGIIIKQQSAASATTPSPGKTNVFVDIDGIPKFKDSSGNVYVALGPQGYQGWQGWQGEQGWQGWQGLQGDQGNQGDFGPQGNQGYQGDQGDIGFQGLQGTNPGPQGDIGPQGFQGNQGNQGDVGFQGLQGTNPGVQGDIGPQGLQGDIGPQGFQGDQGCQGIQGIQGLQGTNPGVQGDIGPQGFQGDQGNQGDFGPQGFQGLQGTNPGVQGPQGASVNMISATITHSDLGNTRAVSGEAGWQGVNIGAQMPIGAYVLGCELSGLTQFIGGSMTSTQLSVGGYAPVTPNSTDNADFTAFTGQSGQTGSIGSLGSYGSTPLSTTPNLVIRRIWATITTPFVSSVGTATIQFRLVHDNGSVHYFEFSDVESVSPGHVYDTGPINLIVHPGQTPVQMELSVATGLLSDLTAGHIDFVIEFGWTNSPQGDVISDIVRWQEVEATNNSSKHGTFGINPNGNLGGQQLTVTFAGDGSHSLSVLTTGSVTVTVLYIVP